MTRYKLILEYNGTNLIGFQANRDGSSVQSLMSDAINKFCGQSVEITGCGRTDAGVHALAMPVHFDLEESGTAAKSKPDTIKRALNFYLGQSNAPISVLHCEKVSNDWHARFDCVARHYKYVILNRDAQPVLDKDFVWWLPKKLDVKKIKSAAAELIGKHDFTSFRATECQAKSPIKTLDTADVHIDGEYIIIEFSAKSFLHHQVRNMVGTLAQIGLGKPLNIEKIFDAKLRSSAGQTAPASGLYFVNADYAKDA